MPTIHQRVLHYYTLPGSIKLSRKKIKKIGNTVARSYDNNPNPPIQYTTSEEDTGSFEVRLYPESMTKTIDAVIHLFAQSLVKTLDWIRVNNPEQFKLLQEKKSAPPPPPPAPEKKKRKRIPISSYVKK